MTDHTAFADTDAKPDVTAHNVAEANAIHNNKRKRTSLDHAGPSRPASGDSARGSNTFQRVSPTSANNTSTGATDLHDQSSASFLTGHNASATAEDDMHHHTNAALDFSAQLAQHTHDNNMHQNGGGNSGNASDTAAAALSHHFSMTVPQATELSFQSQTSGGENDRPLSASFSMGEHNMHQGTHGMPDYSGLDALKSTPQSAPTNESPPNTGTGHKPPVGSDEWHKVRRDNHKEVERRRRETINEGINELAKIVPGCEKNKGSILQRAVQFITQLKENETQNIEKWTLEKLLTEQALSELSASCDKFKAECQRAWQEASIYKKACEKAGIVPEEFQNQGDKNDHNGDS